MREEKWRRKKNKHFGAWKFREKQTKWPTLYWKEIRKTNEKSFLLCVEDENEMFFKRDIMYEKRMDRNKKKTESQQGGSNELEFAIALDITITRSHTRGEKKTNTNFLDKKMKNGWAFFRPWCRKIVLFYYEILSYAIIHIIYSRIKTTLCSEYTYTYYIVVLLSCLCCCCYLNYFVFFFFWPFVDSSQKERDIWKKKLESLTEKNFYINISFIQICFEVW